MKLKYAIFAWLIVFLIWIIFLDTFSLEGVNVQLSGFVSPFFDFFKELFEEIIKFLEDLLSGIL